MYTYIFIYMFIIYYIHIHIYIGKEETNLSLFTDDMIAYIENPKESIKKKNFLELVSKVARSQGKRLIYKSCFCSPKY